MAVTCVLISAMQTLRSDDAEIAYEVRGSGPAVMFLHPFLTNHEFWFPAAVSLESSYRLILPDLRGHGASEVGDGPASMQKQANDVIKVLDATGNNQAIFIGCSIGGYIMFELWRRFRNRVAAFALCDTKPQADSPEERANRLKIAADVLHEGTESYLKSMLPKLMGKTTVASRPDIVEGAHAMGRQMSAEDVSQVQQGMAARPDSVDVLKTINVPTLVVVGAEDELSTVGNCELLHQRIPGSQLRIIPKAGHYAPWEQPEAVGAILRQFSDSVSRR